LFEVEVKVSLKSQILDPSGRAIHGALEKLGLDQIKDVRQGKIFTLSCKGEFDDQILQKIKYFAENFLSNPVIEDYSIEVKSDS